MKIGYNPLGKTLNTNNFSTNDIIFDENSLLIHAHGVIYQGTDTTYDLATTELSGLMSADDKKLLTVIELSSTIKVPDDWGSTAINTNALDTGTYVVQLYINSNLAGILDTYYTGTFTWYKGTPTTELNDEIPLQTIGKQLTNQIYLRTYCEANNPVDLQIAAATQFTGAATLNFKFKRII